MWEVRNRTPYRTFGRLVVDKNGTKHWLVAIRGTFNVAPDGSTTPSIEQSDPIIAPEYRGEDGASSLRYDADTEGEKPNVDVRLRSPVAARFPPKWLGTRWLSFTRHRDPAPLRSPAPPPPSQAPRPYSSIPAFPTSFRLNASSRRAWSSRTANKAWSAPSTGCSQVAREIRSRARGLPKLTGHAKISSYTRNSAGAANEKSTAASGQRVPVLARLRSTSAAKVYCCAGAGASPAPLPKDTVTGSTSEFVLETRVPSFPPIQGAAVEPSP